MTDREGRSAASLLRELSPAVHCYFSQNWIGRMFSRKSGCVGVVACIQDGVFIRLYEVDVISESSVRWNGKNP